MGHAATAQLVLEDGTTLKARASGYPRSIAGEVVFNTGMVGYPEALTDPSYRGQILVMTYPLVGNYGVPARGAGSGSFESARIQVAGLVVSELASGYSHAAARSSLEEWLEEEGVPCLAGVDTRALTKRLRHRGSMLGKIRIGDDDPPFIDPDRTNLVAAVSTPERIVYPGGARTVVVVDCGCKSSIIENLRKRNLNVIRVPWDYDFLTEEFDALVVSNGPGNPMMCGQTVRNIERALQSGRPILGICLGHQLLALAAGARTYKLKFGHRGQNQPCVDATTGRCFITSQNHGYAVDGRSLPPDWESWFTNANDGSNEGMRHRSRPFMSVQFHPEGAPGPVDTQHIFDLFVSMLR
jgi:carbamoyl-phosphate synthase small subunit